MLAKYGLKKERKIRIGDRSCVYPEQRGRDKPYDLAFPVDGHLYQSWAEVLHGHAFHSDLEGLPSLLPS